MAYDWITLLRAGGSGALRLVPRMLLRPLYPVSYRRDQVHVFPSSSGAPSIVAPGGSEPVLIDTSIAVVNLLPAAITLVEIEWQIVLAAGLGTPILGQRLDKPRLRIPSREVSWVNVDNLPLARSGFAGLGVLLPGSSVMLSIHGSASIKCGLGDFEKHMQVTTTATLVHGIGKASSAMEEASTGLPR